MKTAAAAVSSDGAGMKREAVVVETPGGAAGYRRRDGLTGPPSLPPSPLNTTNTTFILLHIHLPKCSSEAYKLDNFLRGKFQYRYELLHHPFGELQNTY